MEKEWFYYELKDAYNLIAGERMCGARIVIAHIENLKAKMEQRAEYSEYSPIEVITSRVKCFPSAYEKCKRRKWTLSPDSFKLMHDIAGVRVITPYLDDVYHIRDAITRRKNLKVDEERDYIENPKPNGYRSLHLIVKTLVPFEYEDEWIPVEIQIRTKAQDFWSSQEHKLRYKNRNPAPGVASELAAFAEELYQKDLKMVEWRDFNKDSGTAQDDNEEALRSEIKPEDLVTQLLI